MPVARKVWQQMRSMPIPQAAATALHHSQHVGPAHSSIGETIWAAKAGVDVSK